MFRLSPLELWTPLILVIYVIAFVRFAQRSKQRQAVAQKAQEMTAEAGRRGVLAQLWLAATEPNLFYAQGDRHAPVPLIVGLLVLTAIIEATPRLIILARAGLAWEWPSAEAIGSAFVSSSLGGVMANFVVFLLMALAVRLGVGRNVRVWTVTGYALSPFVFIGVTNVVLALLAMLSPSLTFGSLLRSGVALGEFSPALLFVTMFVVGTVGIFWLFLDFYLSFRTFFAGVVAVAPERAARSTFLYLGLSAALAIGALFFFN